MLASRMASRNFDFFDNKNSLEFLMEKLKMPAGILKYNLLVEPCNNTSQLCKIGEIVPSRNPQMFRIIKCIKKICRWKMKNIDTSGEQQTSKSDGRTKSICYKVFYNYLTNNYTECSLDLVIRTCYFLSFKSLNNLDEATLQFILRCPQLSQPISSGIFQDSRNLKRTKIIIIGAGIAGLAAAHCLFKAGIQDFKLLEAHSKPGGRIRSCKFKGGYVELGAQWIHGSASDFFDFVQRRGLITSLLSYEGQGHYLRRNRETVSKSLVCDVKEVVENILSECENFYKKFDGSVSFSVGEYLTNEFECYLRSCTSDSPHVLKIKRELFDWHLRFQIIDNSCRNLEDVSALMWGRFKSCGPENFNLKYNYTYLVKTLAAELSNNIEYRKAVTSIEWGNCVSIKCSKSGQQAAEYEAQHVIVTCSVGYINAHMSSLFTPSLPDTYKKGFGSIGFGTINKIFLHYEEAWWTGKEGIQLVWDSLRDNLQSKLEADMFWLKGVTGFDLVAGLPNVLLCWVGGVGAELVETLSDEQVLQHCTILLSIFTGQLVPRPSKILRSKWNSDEYVRGSYSYLRASCDKDNAQLAQTLLAPVYSKTNETKMPRIYFAGEALHECHYSTVHGAFASGQAQASKLVDFLNAP